jgi:hypothetical protein
MAQQRYWNFGDTFTAKKAKDTNKALHKPGRYIGYDITVIDTDKIQLAAGGFVLLPSGLLVSEDNPISLVFSSLPVIATTYSITVRHSDVNLLGGAAALYAIETGELTEVLSDGVVIGYVDHPGGSVALQQSMIRMLDPLQNRAGAPSGAAGGDLSATYPNPTVAKLRGTSIATTSPAEGTILKVVGGVYTPVSASAVVGDGVPAAVWSMETAPTASSTNYVGGLREVGGAAQIQKVILSQEVAGGSGTMTFELYKISSANAETHISTTGSLSITSTQGNLARVVHNSFIPGTTVLLPDDRLGLRVTANQGGASPQDVSVTVILSDLQAAPPPPLDTRAIVQAVDVIVMGNSFVQIGSIPLVPGLLDGSDSRFMIGTTYASGPDASFTLEIRKFGSTTAVATMIQSGFIGDRILGSDVLILEDTFYDIVVKGNSPATIVHIKGFKVVYEPTHRADVRQALAADVTGTTPSYIGSVYLPAGSLQTESSVVLGTDEVAGIATLDIRRFTDSTLVGSISATGVMQKKNPSSAFSIPYPDFYDLYLKADAPSTTAMISGINLVVIG